MTDTENIYQRWHGFKSFLDKKKKRPPYFQEREIWWCSIGRNIGYEVYGKNKEFTRPVLILKKFNAQSFFGLPLTSNYKDIPSHFASDFGSGGAIILDQGRTLDTKRLMKKMGRISKGQFKDVKKAFGDLIL